MQSFLTTQINTSILIVYRLKTRFPKKKKKKKKKRVDIDIERNKIVGRWARECKQAFLVEL
jgi:hypothetical protein